MRHGAALVITRLARAQHILLSQNLVDFGCRKLGSMLAFEKVGDLLPTALLLPLTDGPHPALDQRIDLTRWTRHFTGVVTFSNIALETILLNPP